MIRKGAPIKGAFAFYRDVSAGSGDLRLARFLIRLGGWAPDVCENTRYILLSRASRDHDADRLLLWSVGRFSLHIIEVWMHVDSASAGPGDENGSPLADPAPQPAFALSVPYAAESANTFLSNDLQKETNQPRLVGCFIVIRYGVTRLGQSETRSQAAPFRARNVFERPSARSTVTVHPR
jgi:hypothetical protein